MPDLLKKARRSLSFGNSLEAALAQPAPESPEPTTTKLQRFRRSFSAGKKLEQFENVDAENPEEGMMKLGTGQLAGWVTAISAVDQSASDKQEKRPATAATMLVVESRAERPETATTVGDVDDAKFLPVLEIPAKRPGTASTTESSTQTPESLIGNDVLVSLFSQANAEDLQLRFLSNGAMHDVQIVGSTASFPAGYAASLANATPPACRPTTATAAEELIYFAIPSSQISNSGSGEKSTAVLLTPTMLTTFRRAIEAETELYTFELQAGTGLDRVSKTRAEINSALSEVKAKAAKEFVSHAERRIATLEESLAENAKAEETLRETVRRKGEELLPALRKGVCALEGMLEGKEKEAGKSRL